MFESSSSMKTKRAFLSCSQCSGPRRTEPTSLPCPDHRSSCTSGPSVACVVMGRVLTCNKALLLFIRPFGKPSPALLHLQAPVANVWLLLFFSSPHWRSFFSLSPLSASFWWAAEELMQREGICIHSSLPYIPLFAFCSPELFSFQINTDECLILFLSFTLIDSPGKIHNHGAKMQL